MGGGAFGGVGVGLAFGLGGAFGMGGGNCGGVGCFTLGTFETLRAPARMPLPSWLGVRGL